jgi:dTDP-4-dehydrorhamnose 3,5-epimerase-like enzyme
MDIASKKCKRIITFGRDKKENGWVLEIASDRDNFTENIDGQVYLTVVKPGAQKGFHLHRLKTNHITCIKGLLTVGVFDGKRVQEFKIGEDNFETVKIPPNVPLALYNRGQEDAYVINYCFPAYDPKVKEQEEVDIDWKN